MRLETYRKSALRHLERARDAHRNGARKQAQRLRGEADMFVSQGCAALRAELEALSALATEGPVQAVEDDAYLRRVRGDDAPDAEPEATVNLVPGFYWVRPSEEGERLFGGEVEAELAKLGDDGKWTTLMGRDLDVVEVVAPMAPPAEVA